MLAVCFCCSRRRRSCTAGWKLSRTSESRRERSEAAFWQIVAQIVILDFVFSIDSVVTAVGMVDQFSIMVIAVVVAIVAMMVVSGPLTRFVNSHPTIVILALGFLLMIGFSLFAEGWGFKIPKEYLYAAIVFSVMIETFNQIASRNRVSGPEPAICDRAQPTPFCVYSAARAVATDSGRCVLGSRGRGCSRGVRAGRAHHRSTSAGPGRASGEVDHDARAWCDLARTRG